MKLTIYPAGKGDAFLLTWSHEGIDYNVLIDSGIPITYSFIRADLFKMEKLDAVVITHVDYDHLGGLFKLISDENLPIPLDFVVYMNTPALAIGPPVDDMVNLKHGKDLEKRLNAIGIKCQELYLKSEETNVLEIGGLQLRVLSPTKAVIDELLSVWTAVDLLNQHEKESKDSDKVGKPGAELKPYDEIIAAAETNHNWKDDLINSSSIAFIATFDGWSILFLGDANPDIIVDQLKLLGYSELNKLKVNLVKVSHHGCKHNSTKALFSIIQCTNYLISTNGTGPYYHPDRETIVKLLEYGRENTTTRINLYLNYDLDTSNILTEQEIKDLNINIINQLQIELNSI